MRPDSRIRRRFRSPVASSHSSSLSLPFFPPRFVKSTYLQSIQAKAVVKESLSPRPQPTSKQHEGTRPPFVSHSLGSLIPFSSIAFLYSSRGSTRILAGRVRGSIPSPAASSFSSRGVVSIDGVDLRGKVGRSAEARIEDHEG